MMRALFNLIRRKPLPPREPVAAQVPALQDANLAAVYYGQRMGGDFHDFLRVSPTRVLFGLLDVAGRLEENRGIVAAAQNTFRTAGAELLRKEDVNLAEAVIEVCLQVNRSILKTAGRVHSCPAFAGCYDESFGTVVYFNAGHTPGLVRDGGGVSELPATGLPLGLFSHTTCDASTVFLEPGAALLLVSRGIVEAKCGEQELGLESIKKEFHNTTAADSKELCLSVLDQVQRFMCVPPTHNDVTALALFRTSPAKAVVANV
ncbi:MAG TPA: SpoIIE family protein phosphatase [Terriglobales bacterium]|nr:SpoIIE family protein phosphatase [Terriglobales bacterium]